MDFWIKAAQLILSLAILVTVHEFGHYLAARAFKIRVEKFYLFFDPWFSLLKKKIGDTEWGIGWLPLGGYVKIAGMIDESMDTDQMAEPPKEDEFRSKPAWQRLIVMAAGVIVNVVVGIFIYIMVVAAWGDNVVSNDTLKYGVAVNKNFAELNTGIEDGDVITAVDGEAVENVNLINFQIFLRGYRELEVQQPSGEKKTITLDKNVDDWMWENDAVMAFSPRIPVVVDSVMENRHAFIAGLQKGDSITTINGVETPFFHDLQAELAKQEGDSTAVKVGFYRGGSFQEISTFTDAKKTIGFIPKNPAWLKSTHRSYTFGESISRGIDKAIWTMHDYAAQLPLIFTSKGAQSVGGFGAIGSLFPPAWDWEVFWARTAFISLILAIMNILPIPALDGGHIVFLLYEMITGKEAPQKVLEYAQLIGFLLLISLFLFANGNDVYRAFFK
ncbi:RIP metalloprotease RseP [Brumimicrobium salinarum]|uniref:Zinc metalloprotease n=1 Tax=Brumimicrobium salinarum TaxID=2058658 RepID=A0A2I0QZI7_9FLAO|nr:RIP metalloprotease RseP [Brumimicrobium salinarum]PKR79741.1 RIP metalloprotease RseP [Brumimicrobium salinarum]